MKKFFTLLVLAACCAAMTWGCSDDKYDDTEIRQYNRGIQMYRFPNSDVQKSVIFEGIKKRLKIV